MNTRQYVFPRVESTYRRVWENRGSETFYFHTPYVFPDVHKHSRPTFFVYDLCVARWRRAGKTRWCQMISVFGTYEYIIFTDSFTTTTGWTMSHVVWSKIVNSPRCCPDGIYLFIHSNIRAVCVLFRNNQPSTKCIRNSNDLKQYARAYFNIPITCH